MPQLRIEYSANLPVGDRLRPFALTLHHALAEIAATDVGAFKTRLSRLEDWVIGDGAARHAMFHVDVRLLNGRSDAVKQAVGQCVLDQAVKMVSGLADRLEVQVTVDISDMDRDHYQKQVIAGRGDIV